jgi:ComF family protein
MFLTTIEYLTDVYRLFYPKLCGACNTALYKGEQHICFVCSNNLPFTDFEKLKPNPVEKVFQVRIDVAFATSLLYFSRSTKTQNILHQIKYNNRKQLAIYLGNLLGERIKSTHEQLNFDVIIPVPLHPKKLQIRGYNQSSYIAKGIAEVLNIPIAEHIIKRKINTATQTKKTRVERWQNINNAFELNKKIKLNYNHILLVDDVLTTGATIEACANSLNSKQNLKISVATLAMAI